MYHLLDAYLLSAFVAALSAYLGALIFGAAAVPSVILKTLGESAAAAVLRSYWPRYHRLAVLLGTALTVCLVLILPTEILPAIYSLLLTALAALMTLCFFVGMQLIGSINAARDAGDEASFSRLHRRDIVLVPCGIQQALSLLWAIIYVLPGQFTFWQHGSGHGNEQVVARLGADTHFPDNQSKRDILQRLSFSDVQIALLP